MRTAAQGAARQADPQSGPSGLPRRDVPGFFHFNLSWVVCEPGRITALGVSDYVNRVDRGASRHLSGPSQRLVGREIDAARAEQLSAYFNREGRNDAEAELGAHVLCGRGLRVGSGAQLARVLDAAERKADGTYRCYGGRYPRVATHAIASLRRGVTHEQSATMLSAFVTNVSDRLQVPAEGRVHLVDGRPDHVHIWFGTRVVENGRIGRKQRKLDAVSEKADGRGVAIGDRLVGPTIEAMRAEWARMNRDATGDLSIDHRSYARRGMAVRSVTNVPRTDIEHERRRGTSNWRTTRASEIALRDGPTLSPATIHKAADHRPLADGLHLIDQNPEGPEIDSTEREPDLKVSKHDVPHTKAEADGRRIAGVNAVYERAQALARAMGFVPAEPQDLGDNAPLEELGFDRVLTSALTHFLRGMASDPEHASSTLSSFAHTGSDDRTDASAKLGGGSASTDVLASSSGPRRAQPDGAPPLVTIEDGVRVVADLWKRRRHSVRRVAQVAAIVDVDADVLAAMARARAETKQPYQDSGITTPQPLRELLETWAAEDNQARRERRKQASAKPGAHVGPHVVASAETSARKDDASANAPRSDRAETPEPVRHERDLGVDEGALTAPATGVADDQEAPAAEAPSGADAAKPVRPAGLLRSVIFQAHESDLQAIAQRSGRPWSSALSLEWAIAVRLRATGHGYDEVAAALEASATSGEAQERQTRRSAALAHAFAPSTAEKLQRRPALIARAQRVETQARTKLYRTLRREAMDAFQRDLKTVWTDRRLRADQAARRHAERLDALYDVRRGARRVARDSLVLTTISLLVELAVLQPMIDREKKARDREAQELHDAAVRTSEQLSVLRQQWLESIMAVQAQKGEDTSHNPDGKRRSTRNDRDRPPYERPSQHARYESARKPASSHGLSDALSGVTGFDWQAHHRLVANVALVLAANTSKKQTVRFLGRVVHLSDDRLRGMAHEACRTRFGHNHPGSVPSKQIDALRREAFAAANRAGWVELCRLMKGPRHDRSGRGE